VVGAVEPLAAVIVEEHQSTKSTWGELSTAYIVSTACLPKRTQLQRKTEGYSGPGTRTRLHPIISRMQRSDRLSVQATTR